MKEKLDKMYILASISQSTDSPEHFLDFNNSFVDFSPQFKGSTLPSEAIVSNSLPPISISRTLNISLKQYFQYVVPAYVDIPVYKDGIWA